MKDKEKRNKKGSESTIGKIIYGFLLFMPLFAIGSACLINTFNMSSKEEAEVQYKYETNVVNGTNDIIIGRAYTYTPESGEMSGLVKGYLLSELSFTYDHLDEIYSDETESINIQPNYLVHIEEGYIYIYTDDSQSDYIGYNTPSHISTFDIVVTEIYEVEYDKFSFCDNIPIEGVVTHNVGTQEVFYDAVDKVTESPLFNWAENSIIYTTTNATCNALSITTPFIPLILSYWLIISVMYFLYDIALMLIWVLHDRIHALKDSIT